MMQGRLAKLKIIAFKEPRFNNAASANESQVGEGIFFAQVNPENYAVTHTSVYREEQEPGTQGHDPEWVRNAPREMTFEFLFDGTGAIPGINPIQEANLPLPSIMQGVVDQSLSRITIETQIIYFQNIVFNVQGDTHAPNYLIINWGSLVFKCRLKSMTVSYKLFSSEGLPLRATVNATFMEIIERELEARETNPQSPDITHFEIVRAGDTLPVIAKRIYGDERYYVTIAQTNKIIQFRSLQPGQEIVFLPINKS